jgi:MFS family permease
MCGLLSSSWYVYALTYYELMPPGGFQCLDATANEWYPCEPYQFCDMQPRPEYKIDYSDKRNLHNWVDKLDLACVKNETVGMIGSSFFTGWAVTSLWLPGLGDVYGRLPIFRICMVVYFLAICAIYACFNVWFMIAINFVMGAASSARIGMGVVFMQEFVPTRYDTFVPTLWSFIDAFTYLLITFYFCLVSEEWIPATGIGFIEGFFCLIGCIFLVESPKYLLTKRKYAEAERILNKIAGANKSQAFAFDRQLFGEEEGINFYVLVEGSPDVEEFIRGYKFNGAV